MMDKLMLLPYVFLGGGLGASIRWALSVTAIGQGMPVWWATLSVNIIGTFIYFLSVKFLWNDVTWAQSFLRFGILGSLTTFSSFSFEVAHSLKTGQPVQAAMIFGLNILAGVLIAIGMLR